MPSAYRSCTITLIPGAPPREVVRANDYGYAVAAAQATNHGAVAATLTAWLLPSGAGVAHVDDPLRVMAPLTLAAGASASLFPLPLRLGPGQALAVSVTGESVTMLVMEQEISP